MFGAIGGRPGRRFHPQSVGFLLAVVYPSDASGRTCWAALQCELTAAPCSSLDTDQVENTLPTVVLDGYLARVSGSRRNKPVLAVA
ncbi:hypothetical protein GCM10017655_25320 [Pseudomonas turukhanskensis]|uniref:Uncharacterized protein n=1 Tax=Pseudomonas turukhanskensis TaxID=1806536 RepID=A0A9W6NG48_9PSED|nr:hypothetical protein GCM10017655_25320 [Pseudomonas turukhanskensis]